ACRAPTSQEKAAALKSSSRYVRAEEARSGATRKSLPRPGAPSIRFPKPDFRENLPAPTPVSRLRVYKLLNDSTTNAPPQFFRAADGTQIVKFSDGSTRFIRPGAREASLAAR